MTAKKKRITMRDQQGGRQQEGKREARERG